MPNNDTTNRSGGGGNGDLGPIWQRLEKNQRDLDKINILVERLDKTIDQFAKIASDISTLSTELKTRIDQQEKVIDQLQSSFERYKEDTRIYREGVFARYDTDFKAHKEEVNGKLKEYVRMEQFSPIQKSFFGIISLALTSIAGALVSLVIK